MAESPFDSDHQIAIESYDPMELLDELLAAPPIERGPLFYLADILGFTSDKDLQCLREYLDHHPPPPNEEPF